MSLFDRTFLISTGVTAIICGAIYYYLNSKIRELEQALVKQNQVLSSFIANVQQEFRAMAMARANGVGSSANGMGSTANGVGSTANGMTFEIVKNSAELASPEALAAVAEFDNRKIVISDSDCASEAESDDSDAESDDSGEESDDSDSETESVEHNKLVICDLSLNDMKIIDMSSLGISHLEIYTPEKHSEDEDEEEEEASSDSEESNESEEDGFQRVSKLVIEDVNLNVLDLLNTASKIQEIHVEEIHVEELSLTVEAPVQSEVPVQGEALGEEAAEQEETPAPASKEISKYDDLKVDELRKIVLEKNLAQKEEVKKLKKNELLAVLKKNTL